MMYNSEISIVKVYIELNMAIERGAHVAAYITKPKRLSVAA